MLLNLFKILKKENALFFPPATDEDRTSLMSFFAGAHITKIPQDYIEFLGKTNGLSWNGIELFGTKAFDRPLKSYTFPSLMEVYQNYAACPWRQKYLPLGHAFEMMIVFHYETQTYQTLDRFDISPHIGFSKFTDLLSSLIDDQMKEIKTNFSR